MAEPKASTPRHNYPVGEMRVRDSHGTMRTFRGDLREARAIDRQRRIAAGHPAELPTINKLTPSPSARARGSQRSAQGSQRRSSSSGRGVMNPLTGNSGGSVGKTASEAGPLMTGLFIAGIVLIWTDVIISPTDTDTGDALTSANYENKLVSALFRTTGFAGIMFILALMAGKGTGNTAKFAKLFAVLVDLGILLQVGKNGLFGALGDIVKGGVTNPQSMPQATAPQPTVKTGLAGVPEPFNPAVIKAITTPGGTDKSGKPVTPTVGGQPGV